MAEQHKAITNRTACQRKMWNLRQLPTPGRDSCLAGHTLHTDVLLVVYTGAVLHCLSSAATYAAQLVPRPSVLGVHLLSVVMQPRSSAWLSQGHSFLCMCLGRH
jgi:hypothetical protein